MSLRPTVTAAVLSVVGLTSPAVAADAPTVVLVHGA